MSKNKPNKRVSKSEWLVRALECLQQEGHQGIRIDRLAKYFGIARSGFYWHFRDRSELLQSILDYWTTEFTAVVTENVELQSGDPRKRLYQTMVMILDHDLTKYDLAIRDWATHDAAAAKAVKKVDRMRLQFAEKLFQEMGFRGNQLEMRTRLFICYHSFEQAMFGGLPKADRRMLLKLRYKLFIAK